MTEPKPKPARKPAATKSATAAAKPKAAITAAKPKAAAKPKTPVVASGIAATTDEAASPAAQPTRATSH